MAELLRLIWELIALLKPWREVTTWERGLLYQFGVYRRTLDPGWHVVVPFVHTVHAVTTVPETYFTGPHDVTLEPDEGRPRRIVVTYSAAVDIEVEDPALAWNTRGHYLTTTLNLVAGMVSEALRSEDEDRFSPSRKVMDRFKARLVAKIDERTKVYGVRLRALEFADFLVDVRAVRLVGSLVPHSEKPA